MYIVNGIIRVVLEVSFYAVTQWTVLPGNYSIHFLSLTAGLCGEHKFRVTNPSKESAF